MSSKDKHTIIIGGTRGLGKIVTNVLRKEGHKLSILARNKPEKDKQNTGDVLYIEADLLKNDSFSQKLTEIIKTRGRVHHLIFLQRYRGDGDRWVGDLEISLNATRNIIDFLINEFDTDVNSHSSIVIVSSIGGIFAVNSQPLSYSVAKAGLNQMVRYYAAKLGSKGIRVNAVSPITFLKEESRHYYLENKKLNELYQNIIPLKRMCTADDVANVISFLCSFRASFISGQNIIVDGGLSVVAHEEMARTLLNV